MRHMTRPTTIPDDYDSIPYRLDTIEAERVWVHYGACKAEKTISYTMQDGRVVSATLSYADADVVWS